MEVVTTIALVTRACQAQKTYNGIVVRYGTTQYVLTCYHGITDGETFVIMPDGAYSAAIVNSIKPYDFSVLNYALPPHLDADSYVEGSTSGVTFVPDLPDDVRNTYIECVDVDGRHQHIPCTFVEYTVDTVRTNLYPRIPVMKIHVPGVPLESLIGLSGCAVRGANRVYGMVSYYDPESAVVSAIPSCCLQVFFAMVLENRPITGIFFDTIPKKIPDIGTAQQVTQHFGIKYTSLSGEPFNFSIGDKIIDINNCPFTPDGLIHSKQLDCDVPLETYFALSNMDHYVFNYFPHRKKLPIAVKLEPVEIDKVLRFGLDRGKLVEYRGLIFTEMSEPLYEEFVVRYGRIGGCVPKYYENCYGTTKIVVVSGVTDTVTPYRPIYDDIGLPALQSGGVTYIPVVSRVMGREITDIEGFKNAVSGRKQATIRLEFSGTRDEHLTLNYNGEILTIND